MNSISNSWNTFVENRHLFSKEEFAVASVFKARLDFALRCTALKVEETTPATANGYFALTKLGLAYSAVDALVSLLGNGIHIKIVDESFSEALSMGQFEGFLKLLRLNEEKNSRGRPFDFSDFGKGKKNEDLIVFVRHARHAIFHGSVTPNSAKLTSLKSQKLVLGLADATITGAALTFKSWLTRELRERANCG